MDKLKMAYPFGRCPKCGSEFDAVLRKEYKIEHCPWCGKLILDFIHDHDPPPRLTGRIHPENFIYCDDCGRRIYKRQGKGGSWIDHIAGVCAGPCERELCGNCADWDVNGECERCRNSHCGQCQCHDVLETCRQCEYLDERKTWHGLVDESGDTTKNQQV